MKYDIFQAIRNIENVKLLARTEYFREDVARFPTILRRYNVDFKYIDMDAQNTTSENVDTSIEDKILIVKDNLTDRNYRRLVDSNDQDISLLEYSDKVIGKFD